ncbi:hypothetical protein OH76DRAFT_1022352 [Lentinus brumalis]|uniref:Uncharacterized protein n=1 Tax=Lentinus brumalis TaxID=2498619 RepID=A0A371CY06_9APHY|nr:hypothetical protein OH76DRAFT_1022352 [Polyporus brumalis]
MCPDAQSGVAHRPPWQSASFMPNAIRAEEDPRHTSTLRISATRRGHVGALDLRRRTQDRAQCRARSHGLIPNAKREESCMACVPLPFVSRSKFRRKSISISPPFLSSSGPPTRPCYLREHTRIIPSYLDRPVRHAAPAYSRPLLATVDCITLGLASIAYLVEFTQVLRVMRVRQMRTSGLRV